MTKNDIDLYRRSIEVPITIDMYHRALDRSREAGVMNQYSFTKGKGNIIGFLGEEVFKSAYEDSIWGSGIEYDFKYRGYTIDVKSKHTTGFPDNQWEASVADTIPGVQQDVDIYCFVRIYDNRCSREHCFERYPKAWVCAIYPKDKYLKKSTYRRKGDIDQSNGNVAKYSCYNMHYTEMYNPSILFDLPEKNIISDNKLISSNFID